MDISGVLETPYLWPYWMDGLCVKVSPIAEESALLFELLYIPHELALSTVIAQGLASAGKKAAYLAQGAAEPLCGAAWTPDSQALLVANRGSKQLVALYFTQQPPGMEAQTFPVSLPPSGAHATCKHETAEGMQDPLSVRCLPSAEMRRRAKLSSFGLGPSAISPLRHWMLCVTSARPHSGCIIMGQRRCYPVLYCGSGN